MHGNSKIKFSDTLDSYDSQAKMGGFFLLIQSKRRKWPFFLEKLTVAEIDSGF